MVIYWSRCKICGKYIVSRECTLIPGIYVCPCCCVLFCENRLILCRSPIWFPEITRPTRTGKGREKEKVEKVLMDLLKKLETAKK